MRSPRLFSLVVMVPLAACATGETGSLVGTSGQGSTSTSGGTGGSGGSTGSGASSTSTATSTSTTSGPSTTSGSGGVPTDCTQANGFVGCCDGTNVYYCPKNATAPKETICANGQECGWESAKGYYGCTTPGAGADPSGKYPMSCP